MTCRNPRSMLLLWLALLAVTVLSGCGEKQEPDPATLGPAEIGYTRGGGIAGVEQRVEITGDDDLLVSLNGEPLHGAGVDPGLVSRARSAVEDVNFDRLSVESSPAKPDSFQIAITYADERISGTDEELGRIEQLRPVLAAFDAIIGQASASNPPAAGGSSSG